ncbi:unnamed protein product [marine sediment metagenome]|uniref:Uncharacterized protein n=1 Tax=marine sediment metagenome TaxID=412755 RepID=X0TWR2_9ZZZZ
MLDYIKEILLNKYFGAFVWILAGVSSTFYYIAKTIREHRFEKEQDRRIEELMEHERDSYKKPKE